MNAKSSLAAQTPVEQAIIAKVRAAGLRLRFDKVVLRLFTSVKDAAAGLVGEDQTIVFTLTAPIRLPAKTAAAIIDLMRDGLPDHEIRADIFGNVVRLCRVASVARDMPRVIGLVHNPVPDAGQILALARSELT